MERDEKRTETKIELRPSLSSQINSVTKANEQKMAPRPIPQRTRRIDISVNAAFENSRNEFARNFANELRFKKVYHPKTIDLIEEAMIQRNVKLTKYLLDRATDKNYYYTAYVVYSLFCTKLFSEDELYDMGELEFKDPIDAENFIIEKLEEKKENK